MSGSILHEGAVLILSDMEGVSGILDQRLITSGDRLWRDYGRYLLTEDVNAVALAVYSKGFKRILLSENHDFGRNVVTEELLPFVDVLPPHSANTTIRGEQPWRKLYSSENIVGAIMVGYPGMAGSGGFLSHTLDNKVFEYIKVNGREYGAIGLTAALLGEFNIPLIAVIGDEAAVNEAQRINSLITGVIVKKKKAIGSRFYHQILLIK